MSQSNISTIHLKKFLIPLPDIEEQNTIIKYQKFVDNIFEFYKQRLDLLQSLFRTLLHQLMTAQIRVNWIFWSATPRRRFGIAAPRCRFYLKSGAESPHYKKESGAESPHSKKESGAESPHYKKESGVESPHSKKESGAEPPHFRRESGAESPHYKKESGAESPQSKRAMKNNERWPHAPAHWLFEPGIYMVTASTYKKLPYLGEPEIKYFFQQTLFDVTKEFNWHLHAWTILDNHYHFIALNHDNADLLRKLINKLHMITAKEINKRDNRPGRKIWYQYWDTRISFQRSYLARLNYVNNNPVKHGYTDNAENYPWCSASWFNSNATRAFVEIVKRFKIDRVNVYDDF